MFSRNESVNLHLQLAHSTLPFLRSIALNDGSDPILSAIVTGKALSLFCLLTPLSRVPLLGSADQTDKRSTKRFSSEKRPLGRVFFLFDARTIQVLE